LPQRQRSPFGASIAGSVTLTYSAVAGAPLPTGPLQFSTTSHNLCATDMARGRNRVQFDLKEIGLGNPVIPARVQDAVRDNMVLLFHLNQIVSEYYLICEKHEDLIIGNEEEQFSEAIRKCRSVVTNLIDDVVLTGMDDNSYICGNERKTRK
jgi:hypothetical protein